MNKARPGASARRASGIDWAQGQGREPRPGNAGKHDKMR